jgi:hypothetical protein
MRRYDFQCHITLFLPVTGKPDCGVAPIAEFVNNHVFAITEFVSKVGWMISASTVAFKVLYSIFRPVKSLVVWFESGDVRVSRRQVRRAKRREL